MTYKQGPANGNLPKQLLYDIPMKLSMICAFKSHTLIKIYNGFTMDIPR